MNTGVKAIDKLIATNGLQTDYVDNAFQRVMVLHGADGRIATWKLPWCMYNKIMAYSAGERLFLHVFYLPYRKARLASFLVDERGNVIEQVDYLRERKMVEAIQKLRRMLEMQYQQLNVAA